MDVMAVSAAHQDPPAVARQRVRRALRAFREASPWSQGEVASKLGWSLSKMQRIEGGEVAISVTDLLALLDVYQVDDEALIGRLVADTKTARRQRYVTAPDHRRYLTPALLELMQFEQRAVSIKTYQPHSYPGVLQTPAVAELILAAWQDRLTPDQRRVRYETRMARRTTILNRPANELEYFVILDESVINRRFGDDTTTAEQLDDLATIAERRNMHVRVVPFFDGEYTRSLSSFHILRVSDSDGDAILYSESNDRDELIKEPADVAYYDQAFDAVWRRSLAEDRTLRFLSSRSAALRVQIDRDQAQRENS